MTLAPATNPNLTPSTSVEACGQNRATWDKLDPVSSIPACGTFGAYSAAVLADSPKAFWQMQDASGAPVDSSGNGLNMTNVAGTRTYRQPGPMGGYGIDFAASASVSRAIVSTAVNNLTMEFWIKVTAVTGNTQNYLYNGNGGANGWGLVTNNTTVTVRMKAILGGVGFLALAVDTPTVNEWTYVVVKRDAGTWSYWKNGVVDTAAAGTAAPAAPTGSVTVHGGNSETASYAFIAIYETALSQAQIEAHYAASLPPD